MMVPQREQNLEYLSRHIPNLEVVWDQTRNAMDTFLLACSEAGDDPVVRLEDDIVLTKDFVAKVTEVVEQHPETLIQFFSMRKADLTVGSRWENGASYLMNQCAYYPAGMSRRLIDFYHSPAWQAYTSEHPNGTDFMVQRMLQSEKQQYRLHCPSLVDHLVMKSVIDPRRSSKRQSKTFVDPELEGFTYGSSLAQTS